jgi:hypothetical protein
MSDDSAESLEFDADVVDSFLDSEPGRGVLRAEYPHNQSATAAFWDPRGRGIVSTSYDNTLRREFSRHSVNTFLTNQSVSMGCGSSKAEGRRSAFVPAVQPDQP